MFIPPNENLLWAVHRIAATFSDPLMNIRTSVGTGFWLRSLSDKNVFITNKHVLDPTIIFGEETEYKLNKIELELRLWKNNKPEPLTKFFEVKNLVCIHTSDSADCALLISPKLHNFKESEFPIASIIKQKDLALENDFQENKIKLMEPAIFIGYPGKKGLNWWDEKWKLPVARQCTLASWPAISFVNQQIKSADALLVSGLSFSGSSGSPVFVYNRGMQPGGDLNDPNWRPAQLIGIMSGHFEEDDGDIPQMFFHTGLSYLTRSTAIFEILKSAEAMN